MVIQQCNAVGCFLAKNGSLVSLPLVTVAGLADGVNPCAIGMLLLLLGYLIVFARKPQDVVKIGGVYIATVFLTYLMIGLVFYQTVSWFHASSMFGLINKVIGATLLVGGLIQIKDFWLPNVGPHLKIPSASKNVLMKYVEQGSIPATAVLAVLVTALETPCSLPLYVGTATVLSQSGMAPLLVAGYFIYYNFLFVLPLIVLLLMVWKGKKIIELNEWKHKAERWMQLVLGVLMVLLGIWLV